MERLRATRTGDALQAATREILAAAEGPAPLERIKTALRDITDRFHALGALVHEEEDDEVLLHASEALTIYHITLSPGLQYPAHNHLMDALIGIYRGSETNFIYPAAADRLEAAQRHDTIAPAIVHLPSDAVHSVANTGPARSERCMCTSAIFRGRVGNSGASRPIAPSRSTNARYLAGARPIESR